jgi:hypothetical protein
MNIKQFYVKQKIGGELQKWRENKQNKEHDQIIKYIFHIFSPTKLVERLIPSFVICRPGLPDFFGTKYQNGKNIQNYRGLFQMSIKYNKRP